MNLIFPTEPEKNVAGASLIAMMQECDPDLGFDLVVHKHIKPGSGLGSSAAGSAGAVVAANRLLNNRFSNDDLVRFAMSGEKVASVLNMPIILHRLSSAELHLSVQYFHWILFLLIRRLYM